eukprot:CAMPEP_0182943456 /NCGR_PEP_ID=MMETSP0105_2-20130417/52450_1 /TAXON_ID=81532 ORGANISM="Acanthoeca-like sp., Strain 10tr" /NCGR_SAMPLE_ID=MMETSP0105_2 /ASSEMBLY_ACC=CAM_ASM_000205 /LENGTH=146 /DNA_ID=CAMNT_0025083303 /DNA_START=18 /DNA_END=456 /DNA_ORIENTATION=+
MAHFQQTTSAPLWPTLVATAAATPLCTWSVVCMQFIATTSAVTLQRTTSVPLLLTLPPAALSGCTDSPRHRSSRLNRRSTRITMLTIQISADGTADRMAASVAAKTRSVPSKTQSAQSTISGANATTSSGISCPTGGPIAAAAAAA